MRGLFCGLIITFSVMGTWLFARVGHAQEATQKKIIGNFFPYSEGFPSLQNIHPGLQVGSANAEVVLGVLPTELSQYLAAGDFSITVQQTTDFPTRQAFIDATLAHHRGVIVGRDELQNYVAGRPFPVLDPSDPQAGLKAIWNFRYRDSGDDTQIRAEMSLVNAGGTVERSSKFGFSMLYGMHRTDPEKNVPRWEKKGIYSKTHNMVLSPADMEGSQLLMVTHDKDSVPLDQWAYDPSTRRMRKIVYTPYISPSRGVILIEDRSGFRGYINQYDWKYLGEKTILVPGPIHAPRPTYGGKGGWYLADPWELRRAVIVEGTPTFPHPLYSRRLMYIDLQTYVPLYSFAYDHDGAHKRTFLNNTRHPDYNPWDNEGWFAHVAAQSSIDHQLDRASLFRVTKILFNRALSPNQFTVMSLMLRGK